VAMEFDRRLGVLRPKKSGGGDELLEDFVSLVTTFAGRLYGMRSAQARKRLLVEAGQCTGDGGGQ
jgi:putative resolvase